MGATTARLGLLEGALRRDRLVVGAGLALVTVMGWMYIVRMTRTVSPHAMVSMSMPMSGGPGVPALAWLIPMWIVMMVAMMLPSAAPAILLFASVARRRRERDTPAAPAAVFTLGYLLIWTLYATIAAMAQWGLHEAALLSPAMVSASPWLGGGLLIAAGVYQWLPVKDACLSQCRSPAGLFQLGVARRRMGRAGHGRQARQLLCRLLCADHGPALRCRGDEPALGGGDRHLRARRKDRARRAYARPGHWSHHDRLRNRRDRRRIGLNAVSVRPMRARPSRSRPGEPTRPCRIAPLRQRRPLPR